MPTVTTNSIGTATRDYSTYQAWEDDAPLDLVANDEIWRGEAYADSVFDELVTISGATTDSTRYKELTAAAGEGHGGDHTAGVQLHPTSSGHVFTVSEDHFHVSDFVIHDWQGASSECFRINNTGFTAERMICYDGLTSEQDAFYAGAGSITITTVNCLCFDIERAAIHIQGQSSVTWYCYNVVAERCRADDTARYCAIGFDDSVASTGSTIVAKNCYASTSNTRDDYHEHATDGDFHADSVTNASSDATAPGTSPVTSAAAADQFVSVTNGSEDYHLDTGNALEDAGTDLSADPNFAFSDDFEGDTRSGTWDIGVDEVVTAGQTIAVGLAPETDTSLGVSWSKSMPVNLATETDTGLGATADRAYSLGIASETETAFAVSIAKALAVGLAMETDTGLTATADRAYSLGLATETDTGLAASFAKSMPVDLATETDSALGATINRAYLLGLATETDTALVVSTGGQVVVVGLASEADTGLAAAVAKALAVGRATETDSGLGATIDRAYSLGLATETDTGLAVAIAKALQVGIATETDSALAASIAKALAVGLATETDTALAVTVGGIVVVSDARTFDALAKARTITVVGPARVFDAVAKRRTFDA